jgi:hypothetical protein
MVENLNVPTSEDKEVLSVREIINVVSTRNFSGSTGITRERCLALLSTLENLLIQLPAFTESSEDFSLSVNVSGLEPGEYLAHTALLLAQVTVEEEGEEKGTTALNKVHNLFQLLAIECQILDSLLKPVDNNPAID